LFLSTLCSSFVLAIWYGMRTRNRELWETHSNNWMYCSYTDEHKI